MNEFNLSLIQDKKVKSVKTIKTAQVAVVEITFEDGKILSFMEWFVIYDGWYHQP